MLRSVRSKILVLLAGVLLVALGTYALLADRLFTRDRLAYTYDLTSSLATTVSEQVRESLGSRVDKLLYFAAAAATGSPERQARLLVDSDPDLLGVELWRRRGGRLVREVAWVDPARVEAAHVSREDVDEARRSAPIPFEALGAEGPLLANASLPPDLPLLTLSAAAGDDGSAVVALLKPDRFLRIFARSAAYRIYLVDGRGRVVVHPEPARVLGRADLSGAKVVDEAIRGPVSRAVLDFAGTDGPTIGAYSRVGLGRLAVVAEVSRSEALRASRDLGRRTILFGAAILCVAILASFVLGRSVTAPLRRLMHAAQRIGAGALGEQVAVEGRSEVSELASAFNRMSTALADREARLSEAHHQVSRSDKLSAVGELAASFAHEVKNPVTAVVGYAQLGLQATTLEEARELFALAEAQAWRASDALKGLLEFTRRDASPPEPVDPAPLAAEALRLLRYPLHQRGVEVVSDLPERLPRVVISPGELQQVLVNLMLNAADAMDERPVRRLILGAAVQGESVLLTVRDTGVGIPPELHEKIFQSFFTTKKGKAGTGLGLSVSLRIVQSAGGEIRVESAPGAGASFTVVLPALPEA
jgi:signal transduction histidine kinase